MKLTKIIKALKVEVAHPIECGGGGNWKIYG